MTLNLTLYTYLAPSKVCSGVGVFSLVDIPQDTCIFKPSKMEFISWSDINSNIQNRIKTLAYYNEKGFWIDCDLDKISSQYYINHSNHPNVAYNKDTGELYSICNIQKDEELLDYYFPGERDWLI